MSDYRNALEKIMRLCASSRTYTRRTQEINETAMHALGMTASQRNAQHLIIMERVGGKPLQDIYLARCKKRADKERARQEVNSLDEFDNPLDGQMGG